MAVRQVRVNNRYRSAGRSVFVTGRGKIKEKGTRKRGDHRFHFGSLLLIVRNVRDYL